MSFKSSFKGGQNMAPFIKATIGDDFNTGGEALPTSTSARIQPSKPVPRFSGGDAFCSTPPPDMNQSQIKVPPRRRLQRRRSHAAVSLCRMHADTPACELVKEARRRMITDPAGVVSQEPPHSYRDRLWGGLNCGSAENGTRAKETTRWLALLSALSVVLLALVIWLATEVADNRHAISQLRSDMTQALANDASVLASLNTTAGKSPSPQPPDPRLDTAKLTEWCSLTLHSREVSSNCYRRLPSARS